MKPNSLQRREWLGRTSALVTGGIATWLYGQRGWAAAAEDEPAVEEPWIDAHSHIWSDDVAHFPLAEGQTVADLDPRTFTPEELLKVCRPLGVGRVVLIQHHIYHGWDNTYLCAMAAKYPQRFRVVGMLDDTQSGLAAKMRDLLEQRVTGFRITPWIRGRGTWLEGDGMATMWRTAAETGQVMGCLIDPDDLPDVDAMCRRFPQTPVVIDHFARIGIDGEIPKAQVEQLCGLAKHPRVKVKLSAYYALGRKRPPYQDLVPMIQRLLDVYGVERLMWASDAPYQLGEGNTYEASLRLIQEGIPGLSQGDREQLLRGTAQSTFGFA